MAELELAAAVVVQQVDLVQRQQPRPLAGADLVEHVVDGRQLGGQLVLRGRGVRHVQDQVRGQRLLERRAEGLDQLMGKLADEADSVGQQVAATADLERASRGIQRVEEAVPHAHLGAGERVQQGGLAGVGVAGQGHGGQPGTLALGAHDAAGALGVLEPPAQGRDAVTRKPAISLDLGLARAPGADAAVHAPGAQALEVRPQPAHAREVVLQLRELDLEVALRGLGVVGEDVEDHRGAVDHGRAERLLEVALLARQQLVVARHQVGVRFRDRSLELHQLALAEVAVGVGLRSGAG